MATARETNPTVSMRTNGVWLFVPDTSRPVEEITERAGVDQLPRLDLERDADR